MKTIFAVVLNFNGIGVVEKCLHSLFASEGVRLQVVVVDNASKDASMQRVNTLFPKAHGIFNTSNRGFSGGVNVGIRYALEHGADFVFLLNNDAFVDRDTLSVLLRYAEQRPMAVFSPLIFSSDKKDAVWFCGGTIHWWNMRAQHTTCEKISSETLPFLSEYLTGCALFIPKRAFYDVGLFDEEYFLYYEDADWSVRAKHAGYDLWVIPAAHAIHLERSNRETLKKLYFLVFSGILFFQKNSQGWKRVWISLFFLARRCKNRVDLWFGRKDQKIVRCVFNAYRDVKHANNLRHHRAIRECAQSLRKRFFVASSSSERASGNHRRQ